MHPINTHSTTDRAIRYPPDENANETENRPSIAEEQPCTTNREDYGFFDSAVQTPVQPPRNRRLLNMIAHTIPPSVVQQHLQDRPTTSTQRPEEPVIPIENPSILSLRCALADAGYVVHQKLEPEHVLSRINELHTSIPALIETIHIAKNMQHPVLQTGGTPEHNSYKILKTLVHLFRKNELITRAQLAIVTAKNNPEKIAENLIHAHPYR